MLISVFNSPILFWAILLTFFFFIYFYCFIPLKTLYFYKRQGIKTTYFPVLGIYKSRMRDTRKQGDYFYEAKISSRITPQQKLVACNVAADVVLILRDTDYIKEFLLNQSYFKKAKTFEIFKVLIGQGLLFEEGNRWKAHRKIISSCFHYEFLKNNINLIQETAKDFLDKIHPSEYKDCAIMDKLQEITGEVVGRIFFGRNLNRYSFRGKPLTLALANLMADLGSLVTDPVYIILNVKALWLPIPRFKRLVKRVKEFKAQCIEIVQDRKRDNNQHNDLLDALLAHQRLEATDMYQRLTDEDIICEFITFFSAGMDTTGHLLTMALYNLAQHPEYKMKLKQEREMFYNKEHNVSTETLQNMSLLNSFIKETLRHHTPAPTIFPRVALEDFKLKDTWIKKGTIVRTDPFARYFDSKCFEQPEVFKPERWQDSQMKLDSFVFIPFSAGPRNCIGQHLAMFEAKIILSEFLERFEFSLKDGYKLKMIFRFLYEPLEQIRMDLRRINP